MLNSLHTYEESGRRAARALNVGDVSLWQAERDWLSRLLSLESPRDRREAKRIWSLEYLAVRERWIAARCGYGER